MLPFWSPPSTIFRSSQSTDPSPRFPTRASMERKRERDLFPEPSTHRLITHLSLKVASKGPPPLVLLQVLYGERCSVSRANGLFIHFLYLSESPVKEPSYEMGESIWSLSTEPHVDRRATYKGVQHGSPVRLWHCYHYPSAMQPSAQYLPPWLG
jgi:hypothetical protein